MTYSSAAVCVTSILLGIQLQFEWAPQWVTVCLVNLYAISFNFGAGTVPYILVSEMFLPEVSYKVITDNFNRKKRNQESYCIYIDFGHLSSLYYVIPYLHKSDLMAKSLKYFE